MTPNRRQFFLGWLYAVTIIPLAFCSYGLLAGFYIGEPNVLIAKVEGMTLLGVIIIHVYLLLEPIAKSSTILDR